MNGVRWRDDTGFQGRCDYCLEWWPLTSDFWITVERAGFRMCRGCRTDYARLKMAERRLDPEKRAKDRAVVMEMREALAKHGLLGEYRARWYAKNADKIRAQRRARYAAKRAAEGKPYHPHADTPQSVLAQLRKKRAA